MDSFEEDYVTLTEECHINFEVLATIKYDGEGCYTLPVCIDETYIGEALCDSVANANLMSLMKASGLGNLKLM